MTSSTAEVDEIQAVLDHHPQITRSAVVPAPDGEQHTLVVFYVGTTDWPEPHAVLELLRRTLPAGTCPDLCYALHRLPLDHDGRPDTRLLAHWAGTWHHTHP
ncbi:hypothetical protein ACIQWR_39570 [Streptomyces sp. NPDC098789]|uniref:AMP-binding enzyme n=1 Tax=Streptomyces sp. NPDC098789 TaxID=3366098 RepID=UPI00381BBAB0